MSRCMIAISGTAFGVMPPGCPPLLVERFDADAFDGLGSISVTNDPDRALRFETVFAASAFYRTRSKVRPTRPDGQPNCPMTAFSVTIMQEL